MQSDVVIDTAFPEYDVAVAKVINDVLLDISNAIYAMDVVAKSYGVAFSETLIKQLYDELEKHINQMAQS